MEQAACRQLIDYGGQCFDRHVFQSGGVLAELPQCVLAALAAVGDVVALVAVGNVEQAFVHIRPEHAEFLPCGSQLRVTVQADVARPPVQSNFSVSAHVSTSLYPTAGTDKKLTTNGQLRKKYFPGNKKTSSVHSQRMLKSVRSPRVSAYSIGLLCNPKKPGACISVFSLPEGESFCIGTFGRLWNGLRSVPPCRRNCSFATGNAKRAETIRFQLFMAES